jgi:hypothetical protein
MCTNSMARSNMTHGNSYDHPPTKRRRIQTSDDQSSGQELIELRDRAIASGRPTQLNLGSRKTTFYSTAFDPLRTTENPDDHTTSVWSHVEVATYSHAAVDTSGYTVNGEGTTRTETTASLHGRSSTSETSARYTFSAVSSHSHALFAADNRDHNLLPRFNVPEPFTGCDPASKHNNVNEINTPASACSIKFLCNPVVEIEVPPPTVGDTSTETCFGMVRQRCRVMDSSIE